MSEGAVADDGSDTEMSEIGDGLLSIVLSSSSYSLDDCANSILTSHYKLIIETIDLHAVAEYLSKQGAISDAANVVLSNKSQPLGRRKNFFLTHIIKDKGIDGFNLLVDALKSCEHDPSQVALGEKLYMALQQTFSSSDSSREASPMSVAQDEWVSAYESATDEPLTSYNTPTSVPAPDTTSEQTPLISSASPSNSSSLKHRKKKVTVHSLVCLVGCSSYARLKL